MSNRERAISRGHSWALIGLAMVVVLVVCAVTDFRLAWPTWLIPVTLVSALLAVSWFYANVRRVDDGRISETLRETAILIAYGPPAAAISYMVASAALPLIDKELAAIDLAVGFDWIAWYRWVEARPMLQEPLSILYPSSLPHIALMLIATGLMGRTERSRELNVLLIATSLPMVAISGVLPALSAWVHYGFGLEKAYHLDHFLGLRAGNLRELRFGALLGIITFPSFHTAISLVLVWVARGIPWLFWPTLTISVGVLLSIPSEGGHYLVDMMAGAIITVIAILAARRHALAIERSLREKPSRA